MCSNRTCHVLIFLLSNASSSKRRSAQNCQNYNLEPFLCLKQKPYYCVSNHNDTLRTLVAAHDFLFFSLLSPGKTNYYVMPLEFLIFTIFKFNQGVMFETSECFAAKL